VGFSTSPTPKGLHGLLQGQLHFSLSLEQEYCSSSSYLDVVGVELVARQGIKGAEVLTSREDPVTSTAAVPEENPKEHLYTNGLKEQHTRNSNRFWVGVRVSLGQESSLLPNVHTRLWSPLSNRYRGLGVKLKVKAPEATYSLRT
jgi:hypothetical protein